MDLASSFGAIASSLTDGFVTIDAKGVIVAVNPAIEKIFGYEDRELVGQNISILMPPQEGKEHQGHLDASTVGKRGRVLTEDRTLQGRKRDGTIIPVTITVFSLQNDEGDKYFLGLISDNSAGEALREERSKNELLYHNIDLLNGAGLWRINIETGALEWTEQIYEMHGLDRETFKPTVEKAIACYYPEDRQKISASVERAVETGASFEFTGRISRPDGTTRYVRSTGRRANAADGTPIAIFGTTIDITDLQEREKHLSLYSQQQTILKDILYQYSQGGTVEDFSDRVLQSLAKYPWSPSATAHALFLPNAQTHDFCATASDGFSDDDIADLTTSCTAPEKAQHPEKYALVPISHNTKTLGYLASRQTAQGAATYQEDRFLSAITDILAICLVDLEKQETIAQQNEDLKTEIIKVQKLSGQFERQANSLQVLSAELEASKEEAETASETKSAFLANMSHEVRTPLNGVLGMLSMLELSSLDEDQHECIDMAKQSAYAALSLMNDLLDLSQLTAGKLSITPEEFLLNDLLARIEAMLTPKAEKKYLSLVANSELGECTVEGDPLRIQQIVINLGDNAIKFTDTGRIQILFSQDPETQNLQIVVEDTGQGMTPGQLERIFGRFEQADNSKTRHTEGVGLGLSISKNLAELMGGDITVTSQVGQGTCFTVTLPVPLSKAGQASPRKRKITAPTARPGLTILAAEDNKVNREILKRLAKLLSIDMTLVNNGAEAVAALETQAFDIILMDIQMPIMDGISATKAIRETGSTIPILAVSADVMEKDKQRFLEAGMDGHIGKPYEIGELIEEIERLVDFADDEAEVTQPQSDEQSAQKANAG